MLVCCGLQLVPEVARGTVSLHTTDNGITTLLPRNRRQDTQCQDRIVTKNDTTDAFSKQTNGGCMSWCMNSIICTTFVEVKGVCRYSISTPEALSYRNKSCKNIVSMF